MGEAARFFFIHDCTRQDKGFDFTHKIQSLKLSQLHWNCQ